MIENDLIRTIRGENVGKVPFWEVWYGKGEMARRIMGGPLDSMAKEAEFARRMGWQHIICGVWATAGLPAAREVASDGTSHYVQGGFHSMAQLEEVKPLDIPAMAAGLEKRVRAAHDEGLAVIVYVPWCFHTVATAMGLEAFAFKTVDDIDFLHTAMEFVETRNRQAIEGALIPLGVDAVLFDGDCAYKNGLMVRPQLFRELVFDRTARTVAPLKAAGIPYTFHSDGKLDDVIPVLIELGFSAVHGVEAAANDLADIKARFGKDITLIGNMDVVFLTHATVPEIRRKTGEMLRIGSPGGRYIAACNTSPCDYIPDDHYMAMVDVIRNFKLGPDSRRLA